MAGLKPIKTQVIIFLCAFALYLSFRDRDTAFLFTAFIAVISAAGSESAILFFKNRKLGITESSVISGLIIGYVLSSDNPWWIFFLAALITVSSKQFIQIQKKHLFNPAALGIFLVTLFFGASTQWKGTYLWHILLPFGLYFAYRMRKIKVLIGYGLVALGLFGVQAFLQKTPLLNIFGYLSYFYIFVMMIEPKTTPVKPRAQLLFGIGIAFLIFILTEAGARFDVELLSLLALNLSLPLLNKMPQ